MSDRIWIWFADNGNIRKWQRGPFEEGTEYVVAAHADAELDEMTRSCLAEREGRIKAEAKLAGGEVTEAMVERMARWLANQELISPDFDNGDGDGPNWRLFEEDARSALEAALRGEAS